MTLVKGSPRMGGAARHRRRRRWIGTALIVVALALVPAAGTATQQQKLIASDGVGSDQFGFSVALSGDTAIVGSVSNGAGSAYVFVRSGTVWTEQQQLTASDGVGGDQFGISVALNGDTAIIGADFDAFGANAEQGSAYVFVRNGGVWTQQQKLAAPDGAFGDQFGFSVALSGDTAIVGVHADNPGATDTRHGSAYIFTRTGTIWAQQQKLTASDGSGDDEFGRSVALNGDTAIVGAHLDNVGANADQGSAYLFVRTSTTWVQQQQLTASDGAASDTFGGSVALSGNSAIVGAHLDDVGANGDQGSAYVYIGLPTAVSASAMTARRSGASVIVHWRGTDPRVLGYNLYRSQRGRLLKLNRTLIPSVFGGTTRGHTYSWLDRTARRGVAYTYRLQSVSLGGTRAWLGTVIARR